MNPVRLLRIGALFAAASLPAAAQVVWNPTTAFSTSSGNPNGVWTYGYMNLGFTTFTAYTNFSANSWHGWGGDQSPAVWVHPGPGTAYGVPAGYLSIHPGNGNEPSVLRWTAPANYSGLTVSGQFLAGDSGSMQIAIFQNTSSNSLFSATDAGTFNFMVNVLAGDTLNFAVFGGYFAGNTPLQLTVTAVPEPATASLIAGVTAALLVALARRRRSAHGSLSDPNHSGHVSRE